MNDLTKNQITRLEISKKSILHNINYYRANVKKGTKVLAMVKAFSYGVGDIEFSEFLEEIKVDYLGVANSGEGAFLRNAGCTLPIIVMNPNSQSYKELIKHTLEPEIYNFKVLEEFKEELKNQDSPYPIHIKLDTGMNRLGFQKQDIPKLISELKVNDKVIVKSIFSHLAGADEKKFDEFTKQQIKLFKEKSLEIESELGYKVMKHILNSSGSERFPEAAFDMIRLGIGMYGFSPNNQDKLKNVSSLKSKILQIKNVSSTDTVGYSRKGKLKEGGTIAVIGAGYGDGVTRILGNKALKVIINGNEVPLVGNVCMDMCMADITGIKAKEGDDVIFFGDKITAADLAGITNTISYEIVTGISQRVKRILI